MIRKAFIIGNLVRDPETKTVTTANGDQEVTRFSVAVNHGFGKDTGVSYFDCVAWNGLGKALAQYRSKGDQVAVEGDLQQSRWEKDGAKHSKIEITARSIEYLRSKGDGAGNSNAVPDEVLAETAPVAGEGMSVKPLTPEAIADGEAHAAELAKTAEPVAVPDPATAPIPF